MSDNRTADQPLPASIVAALAAICGYADNGQPCDNCLAGTRHDLARGASEADILADIALYRDDWDAWYAKHLAARADRVRAVAP